MELHRSSRAGAAARRHFIGGEWVDSEAGAMFPSLDRFTGEAIAKVAADTRGITVQSGSHPFPF